MLQTQYTYQTATTITVSQDYETPARSSPPPDQAPPAGAVNEEAELVEDSLNANAPAIADDTEVVEDSVENRAAAPTTAKMNLNRPSQQAQTEHDELYSVTPDRPRAKPAQSLSKASQYTAPQRKVSNNALDALLTRGATVHKIVQKSTAAQRTAPIVEDDEDELQRSQGERTLPIGAAAPRSAVKAKRPLGHAQRRSDAEDEEDELQSFEDDLSAPVGSHPLSSKKKAKGSTASKATAAVIRPGKAKMASKPAPVNATGSLAALRQRRGQDAAIAQATPTAPSAKPVLQPRDVNVQTPAVSSKDGTKKTQQNPPASTAGKLPPVKKGTVASTPNGPASNQAEKSITVKAKMKGAIVSPADDSSIAVGPATKTTQKVADKRQSLKRPAKVMKETDARPDSTFDVPQSPQDEDEEEYKPNKKTRKGKAPQRKRLIATSSAAGSPVRTKKTASKPQAKKNKPSPEPEVQALATNAGPSKSTRAARMKAESGTVGPAPSAKKSGKAVEAASEEMEDVDQADTEMRGAEIDAVDDGPLIQSSKNDIAEPALERDKGSPNMARISKFKKEKLHRDNDAADMAARRESGRGASQQDAIELSDGQSSSDDELSPMRGNKVSGPESLQAQSGEPRQHLRTPAAAMRSSPPVAGGASTKPTTGGLIDPASARKSTIISFDKSGPRNQGNTSARPTRTSLAPADRSSLPPVSAGAGSLAQLQARRQEQTSSGAKISKTFMREASAAPSNVAANAQEALAGLRRQSLAQSRPATQQKAEAKINANRPRDLPAQAYQDDGVAEIEQFGDDTTLVDDGQVPRPGLGVNASQSHPTLSQQQMPPPKSKTDQKPPVHKASTVPSMKRANVQDERRASNVAAESSVLGKRQQIERPTATEEPSKRVRRSQGTQSITDMRPDSLDSITETTVVQRKPAQPKQQAETAPQRALSQRQARRQKSQGTVDIHGSPVPEGMVVAGVNTVLETFSQQADLSSDQVESDGKTTTKVLDATSSDLLTVKAAHRQPARLSSNTKALPAEPSQESQAITHVARVPVGARPFVATGMAAHPQTDPFTSSEEERIQPDKGSSSTSAFSEHLKQQAARGPAHRSIISMPPPANDNDPDKTLVDEEGEDPAPPQRKPKRIESFDSNSSSDISTDTEDTSASLRDLGIWRKALKPHQMNLFDELVTISHRLVRHLVDQEEATTNIVDDYRRRGEELIENLQAGQAKDMQAYYDSLKGKKRRLQKEMNECGRRLAECSDGVRSARKEVRKQAQAAAATKGRDEEELREVMGAFC